MLWELILGATPFTIVFDIAVPMILLFAAIIVMKRSGYLMFLTKAKFHKLAIIVDKDQQCYFSSVDKKGSFQFLKNWSYRAWAPEGSYYSPQLHTTVGLAEAPIGVSLPVHKGSTAAFIAEVKREGGDDKTVESTAKEIGLSQTILQDFYMLIGDRLNPVWWISAINDKARKLADLNKEDKKTGGFDLKWLVIIGIVGLMAVIIIPLFMK